MAAASWGLPSVGPSLVLLLPITGGTQFLATPRSPCHLHQWAPAPLTSRHFSCHSMLLDAPPILKTPGGQDVWVNWDGEFAYRYIQAQVEAKVPLWVWWKLRLGPAALVRKQQ